MSRIASSTALALWLSASIGCGESGTDDDVGEDSTGEGSGETSGDGDTGDASSDGETSGDGDDTSGDGDGDDTTGDTDGETGNPDCTGPQGTQPLPAEYEQPAEPKVPGSTWPYFELTDFQPQSCNFGQTYGLETFKGRVTLISTMRSTCEICQGTIGYLEQMQIQLELEGYDVWFLVLNQPGYDDSQQEFIDRASFPLIQDTFEVAAWDLFSTLEPLVGTDDIYIYTADGILSSYFSYSANDPTIMLETQAGWDNVYNAILAAM